MFRDAKVGDKVWDIRYGWGVIKIPLNILSKYPVYVDFGKYQISYTIDGKLVETHSSPLLFWDEVSITPPPKPRLKVVKWRWVTINLNNKYYTVSESYYKDSKDFIEYNPTLKHTKLVQKIEETHRLMYENEHHEV